MNVELAQKQKLSNFEIIMEMFEGKRSEGELTHHQSEYLRMLRATYSMMLDLKSKSFIVQVLMGEFDMSQSNAYRIIKETGRVFSTVDKVDKIIHQNVAIEMAKRSFQVAFENRDAMAMTQATKAYYVAVGLDKDDADLPVFEKLQPSLIIALLPDSVQRFVEQQLNQGVVDLNTIPTQDIEHEELESKSE